MALKLKVAPKNVYWAQAIIICGQDYDEEPLESKFGVQFERFTYDEQMLFNREQQALSQHAAVGLVRRLKDTKGGTAEAAKVLQAGYDEALAALPEGFDPGADFALRWLQKKVRSFRDLLTEDDQQVSVEDLPDLVQIISYRVGLMQLLRKQLEDPNLATEKN